VKIFGLTECFDFDANEQIKISDLFLEKNTIYDFMS
jgi:hypothetical protein